MKSQVEWALHCCGILASLPEGADLATKDLAEFHGVPKEYLSKALQALSMAGIVSGSLGPKGGYRLAKPASAISFLDIVEAVEGRQATFECSEIRKNIPCRPKAMRDTGVCQIARVMYKADEAWRRELRAVTLADLSRTLAKELPAELTARIGAWIGERV